MSKLSKYCYREKTKAAAHLEDAACREIDEYVADRIDPEVATAAYWDERFAEAMASDCELEMKMLDQEGEWMYDQYLEDMKYFEEQRSLEDYDYHWRWERWDSMEPSFQSGDYVGDGKRTALVCELNNGNQILFDVLTGRQLPFSCQFKEIK